MGTLALAAQLVVSTALPSQAQDATALRGGLDASDSTASIPSYQPVSQGALPEPGAPAAPGDASGGTALAGTGDGSNSAATGDPSLPLLPPDATVQPAKTKKKPTRQGATAAGAVPDIRIDNLRTQSVGATTTQRVQTENQREMPAGGRPVKPDSDPYGPLGVRIGAFILRPTLEQGLRATTNGDVTETGRAALLSETSVDLEATSDWSRHKATLHAFGSFDKSVAGQDVSEPTAGINGTLRLDLADGTAVTSGAGYELQRESANTPDSVTGTASQPIVQTLNANLGVERNAGLFFAKATGSFERQIYGDATLSGGGTISQSERNNNYASLTLRGGINLSDALRPFVEAELGRVIYDERVDTSGYQRSADRFGLRGGLTADFGDKLKGEVSAGYIAERFDDPRLALLGSPTVAASLDWSPHGGTTVTTNLSTTLEDSTTAGENGDVLYASSVSIVHSLRANLDLTTTLGAWLRDLKSAGGYDYGGSAQAGIVYWFNRFVGLDTSARYQIDESADPSRRAREASVFVGLKLRR
jgi:hypothetical protein